MVKLIQYFYHLFILNIDRLFIRSSKIKNGVVIVRLDAIGDFVIWSHSAGFYRELFPGKKITLVANSSWSELAQQLPYWDKVYSIDLTRYKKDLLYRWMTLRRISRFGFEVAIQPTYSRNSLQGDSIIRATQAKMRIGSKGNLSNMPANEKAISDKWYTLFAPARANNVTELERNMEFLNSLSAQQLKVELRQFPVFQSLPESLKIQREYVIFFPGASWQGRQWPSNRFVNLIQNIKNEFDLFPVLCGSLDERDLCQQIIDESGVDCLNTAGETRLIEFIELVRNAKFVVGNETSVIHISAAVGVPSICITGGGHYGRFVPYPESVKGEKPRLVFERMVCFHCNWQCTQGYKNEGAVPCLERIQVQSVMKLIRELNGATVAL